MRRIVHILPPRFRRRGIRVAVTLFLRALLNMVGLAMLIPMLTLALDPESLSGSGMAATLYEAGGFRTPEQFAWAAAATIILIIVLKCGLNFLLARVERRYIYDLYTALSTHLYRLYHHRGLPFIKSQNSAMLARNVNVVCLAFTAGVLKPAAAIGSELMLLTLLFGALALYAPLAALLTLGVFLPATWCYYRFVRRRINRYGEMENRAQREKSRIVAETFRGYADIELNGAFPMMLQRFEQAMREVVATRSKEADIGLLPAIVTELGLAIGIALLAALSFSLDAANSHLLFGLFAVAALRLMPAVRALLSSWTTIRYNLYTIEILEACGGEELPLATTQEDVTTHVEALPFTHEIRLCDLTFCFPDTTRPLFEHFSLTIRKGERIGIQGCSGAGKTTLFNLLLGFYEPTGGSIEIDGVPLTTANRRRWQQRVGYVSQTLFLIDGTFAENVALGLSPDAMDRRRIEEALEAAQLGEFIRTLPQGIDTPIGECGCRLSGGQRQRIGIARALYRRADVLLLDEATSALDSRTEQEINQSVARLAEADRSLTVLVIAHRESSLTGCDRIITLETPQTNE